MGIKGGLTMTFEDLMGSNAAGPNDLIQRLYKKNRENFEELIAQIKKGSVVPLLGAGFSATVYPSWSKLLIEMAQPFPNCKREVEESVESGSFERAASLLCEEMGEFEFLRKLHGTFGRHTLSQAIARISSERKTIPQIFTGPLMTTNVDQMIEEIYARDLPVLCPHTPYQQPQAERALQSSTPILFKLHGDIEDREHVVFTQEQYDEVYGRGTEDTPLVQTMKQIFSGKTVLFLGCSLASDRVLDVLKRCCANHAYCQRGMTIGQK